MARVRRSDRRATALGPPVREGLHGDGVDLDRVGHPLDPELARVGDAVRTAAEAALGHRPDLAASPEPVLAGCGPHAYRVRLATDDPAWARSFICRASPPPVLGREAAWIDEVRSGGFPAPDVVSDGDGDGVLVFREPTGTNLAERMITDMASLPRLLADFGRLHAALHALPVAGSPDDRPASPDPSALHGRGAPAGSAGVTGVGPASPPAGPHPDEPGVDRQVAWLIANAPVPNEPAVGHGDLTPAHVYLDGDLAVVVNWTGAGLADPEHDVAATLTGFWTAALYVDSAVQRRMLKMVRDSLAGAYLSAYRDVAVRQLDDARLRYHQAFHLCRVAAGIVRCRTQGPDGPWDTAAHIARADAALDELAREFWRLAD